MLVSLAPLSSPAIPVFRRAAVWLTERVGVSSELGEAVAAEGEHEGVDALPTAPTPQIDRPAKSHPHSESRLQHGGDEGKETHSPSTHTLSPLDNRLHGI